MKRTTKIIQSAVNSASPAGSRRAGVLMAWTIWIMLFAGLVAGGVFNAIYVSGIRNEAYNCAASASLAAGYGYLSDDLLRLRQESFEIEGRMTRSRQSALMIVDQYRSRTRLPAISEDDIHLILPELPGPATDASQMVPTQIDVCFDGKRNRNTIPLFFAGLTGVDRADLGVRVSTRLEHSPIAFRPGMNISIPVLPFAICDEMLTGTETGSEESGAAVSAPMSGYWSSNVESGMGQDAFSWNAEVQQFENGPDGLPEITVTIYSTTSVGHDDAFIPMPFGIVGSEGAGGYAQWIRNGVTGEELLASGREEISFPGAMPIGVMVPQDLASCATALRDRIGEACIICLCSTATGSGGTSSGGTSTVTLKRPVAARVVQVNDAISGSVKVTLQPCVLTTSTAVTSPEPNAPLNRYIYSVRLCQ